MEFTTDVDPLAELSSSASELILDDSVVLSESALEEGAISEEIAAIDLKVAALGIDPEPEIVVYCPNCSLPCVSRVILRFHF